MPRRVPAKYPRGFPIGVHYESKVKREKEGKERRKEKSVGRKRETSGPVGVELCNTSLLPRINQHKPITNDKSIKFLFISCSCYPF
jgi:hypothetical protein